jgi:hypothetical protein
MVAASLDETVQEYFGPISTWIVGVTAVVVTSAMSRSRP